MAVWEIRSFKRTGSYERSSLVDCRDSMRDTNPRIHRLSVTLAYFLRKKDYQFTKWQFKCQSNRPDPFDPPRLTSELMRRDNHHRFMDRDRIQRAFRLRLCEHRTMSMDDITILQNYWHIVCQTNPFHFLEPRVSLCTSPVPGRPKVARTHP